MNHQALLDRISIDPAVCHGKPCIRGHRVWVSLILDLFAGGMSSTEVLAQYPGLVEEDTDEDLPDPPHRLRAASDHADRLRRGDYAVTTTIDATGSTSNASRCTAFARTMASISAVVRLPTRSQTTFGGLP